MRGLVERRERTGVECSMCSYRKSGVPPATSTRLEQQLSITNLTCSQPPVKRSQSDMMFYLKIRARRRTKNVKHIVRPLR
jgi:hypothetical protein